VEVVTTGVRSCVGEGTRSPSHAGHLLMDHTWPRRAKCDVRRPPLISTKHPSEHTTQVRISVAVVGANRWSARHDPGAGERKFPVWQIYASPERRWASRFLQGPTCRPGARSLISARPISGCLAGREVYESTAEGCAAGVWSSTTLGIPVRGRHSAGRAEVNPHAIAQFKRNPGISHPNC